MSRFVRKFVIPQICISCGVSHVWYEWRVCDSKNLSVLICLWVAVLSLKMYLHLLGGGGLKLLFDQYNNNYHYFTNQSMVNLYCEGPRVFCQTAMTQLLYGSIHSIHMALFIFFGSPFSLIFTAHPD